MPLTAKGEKIKKNMEAEYGAKKGKQVFYASQNKGTIKGTHNVEKKSNTKGTDMNEAYAVGFCEKCAAAGVDAEALVKSSARYDQLLGYGQKLLKSAPAMIAAKGMRGSGSMLKDLAAVGPVSDILKDKALSRGVLGHILPRGSDQASAAGNMLSKLRHHTTVPQLKSLAKSKGLDKTMEPLAARLQAGTMNTPIGRLIAMMSAK